MLSSSIRCALLLVCMRLISNISFQGNCWFAISARETIITVNLEYAQKKMKSEPNSTINVIHMASGYEVKRNICFWKRFGDFDKMPKKYPIKTCSNLCDYFVWYTFSNAQICQGDFAFDTILQWRKDLNLCKTKSTLQESRIIAEKYHNKSLLEEITERTPFSFHWFYQSNAKYISKSFKWK